MDKELRSALRQLLERKPDTNKYDYGHVLIIGGAPGMIGAPLLGAEAALRSGAGLVSIASTGEVVDKLERRVKEVMTLRLAKSAWDWPKTVASTLQEFIKERKVTTVAIGSGMGRSAAASNFIRSFLAKNQLPAVVDADALFALAGHLNVLDRAAKRNSKLALTPHPGEYARLSKDQPASFSKKHGTSLVLKGPNTRVFHPDGTSYQNTTGNAGLATAGSGDVLSGIIAAFLGQLPDFKVAIEAAVYIHGSAGDLAAQAKTQPGMIASDIIS